MQLFRQRDFLAGLVFFGLALMIGWRAVNYRLGTAASMGPGYFPLLLSVLLLILGVAITVQSLNRSGTIDWSITDLRSACAVLGSVIFFGLLIQQAGLLVTVIVTSAVCQMGARQLKWRRTIISSLCLSFAAWGLFVWLLQVSMPVFPRGI